jgi:hypothetical protein
MVIFSKFLDFVMFGTGDLGHNGKKLKQKITIFINHHTCICPIFHAVNDLSKLQFNFAHFIALILTLRGPTSLAYFVYHVNTLLKWITSTCIFIKQNRILMSFIVLHVVFPQFFILLFQIQYNPVLLLYFSIYSILTGLSCVRLHPGLLNLLDMDGFVLCTVTSGASQSIRYGRVCPVYG